MNLQSHVYGFAFIGASALSAPGSPVQEVTEDYRARGAFIVFLACSRGMARTPEQLAQTFVMFSEERRSLHGWITTQLQLCRLKRLLVDAEISNRPTHDVVTTLSIDE
jgi:hypothetical protein